MTRAVSDRRALARPESVSGRTRELDLSIRVFEVEKANYGSFTPKLHDALGRSLRACSPVQGVWIAAENSRGGNATYYLQFALKADGDHDEIVAEMLPQLEREHRLRLAIAPRGSKSDCVPGEIVRELKLKNLTNPYVTLHRRLEGIARV